jgi:hypothetical protein
MIASAVQLVPLPLRVGVEGGQHRLVEVLDREDSREGEHGVVLDIEEVAGDEEEVSIAPIPRLEIALGLRAASVKAKARQQKVKAATASACSGMPPVWLTSLDRKERPSG